MSRKTEKLYYKDQYLSSTTAQVVHVWNDGIELDKTVAFPVGGGQESDFGTISKIGNIKSVRFSSARRIRGTDVKTSDSSWVNVDGIIIHEVGDENIDCLNDFKVGDNVVVSIDTNNRELLSISHSASHLLYMAVQNFRPDLIPGTIGCHIKPDQARFDFLCEDRITVTELEQIEEYTNTLVNDKKSVETHAGNIHPDARIWKCSDAVIDCGGTHISNTGVIGPLKIKRKNIGKRKERLICQLMKPTVNSNQYH